MDVGSERLPILTEVANQKDSPLFSSSIFEKIQSILEEFRFAKDVLLEFSLDQDDRVDINVNIWQSEMAAFTNSQSFLNDSEWKHIVAWADAWQHQHKPFRSYIPNIWLVFDVLDSDVKKATIPWLILTLASVPISQSLNFKMAANAVDVFTPVTNHNQLQALERAFQTCPQNGSIPGICVFEKSAKAGRQLISKMEQIVRIGVRSFYTYSEIKNYLTIQKWKGNYEALEKGCADLIPLCSYAMLSLNFDVSIMDTIGIECYFDEKNNKNQVSAFLTALEGHKLCSASKKDQILKHIMINQATDAFKIHQWVLEIKLVLNDANEWKAKVYFLYQRRRTTT